MPIAVDSHLSIVVFASIGLALFLFGMQRLEAGIRQLGLNTFQVWLTRATSSSIASVATGIGVTAILQSSSLVSLLVLAFASAEVLPLYNAIGILIGANLGTTFTGWLVTALGFKLSLSNAVLPLLGIGAALQWVSKRWERLGALGWVVFGIGMLLFGLSVMKESTEQLTQYLDIGALKGHGYAVYFLVGVVVAAIIQSSSATMMLTLMALNSDLIALPAAAAIVIGADLGTTSTTVLASLGGSPIKRRLALAHLVFNVTVDCAALFFLLPLLPAVEARFTDVDPLVMLVGFHSVFNVIGVIVFLPLLRPFSNWIGRQFSAPPNPALRLHNQPPGLPKVALIAIDNSLFTLGADFALLILQYLRLSAVSLNAGERMGAAMLEANFQHMTADERYRQIKAEELAILSFALDVERETLTQIEDKKLAAQTQQARVFAYSAKTLKDIHADMDRMADSPIDAIRNVYDSHHEFLKAALESLFAIYEDTTDTPHREKIDALTAANELHYSETSKAISDLVVGDVIEGEEPSTLLNINRDIHHAIKGLISASKHWHPTHNVVDVALK